MRGGSHTTQDGSQGSHSEPPSPSSAPIPAAIFAPCLAIAFASSNDVSEWLCRGPRRLVHARIPLRSPSPARPDWRGGRNVLAKHGGYKAEALGAELVRLARPATARRQETNQLSSGASPGSATVNTAPEPGRSGSTTRSPFIARPSS